MTLPDAVVAGAADRLVGEAAGALRLRALAESPGFRSSLGVVVRDEWWAAEEELCECARGRMLLAYANLEGVELTTAQEIVLWKSQLLCVEHGKAARIARRAGRRLSGRPGGRESALRVAVRGGMSEADMRLLVERVDELRGS